MPRNSGEHLKEKDKLYHGAQKRPPLTIGGKSGGLLVQVFARAGHRSEKGKNKEKAVGKEITKRN